jgi:hypothetical protein
MATMDRRNTPRKRVDTWAVGGASSGLAGGVGPLGMSPPTSHRRLVLEVGMNVPMAPRRRIAATLALLTLAPGFAAACTNSGSDSPEPGPTQASSTPTPTVDPSFADAEQQARAAYAGYIETWARALQAADPDTPDLTRYAADPLLSLTRHNIRTLKDKGAVQIGAQTAAVRDAKVDLAVDPPTVTINSCLDYSGLRLVYRANRSPVPGSRISDPKVSAIATVTKYPNGQWLVNESKQGRDTC